MGLHCRLVLLLSPPEKSDLQPLEAFAAFISKSGSGEGEALA